MARIRYLKPDFFVDPDLIELSFAHRLVFAGLWGLADKAGRLTYEPKKLKIQIMPCDKIDMVGILADLSKKPFLHIYEVQGHAYIQIINWEKHQSPHHTEKESLIPPFKGDITVKEPLLNRSLKDKGEMLTIPLPINHTHTSNTTIHKDNIKWDFDALWAKYPRKIGKHDAQRHFNAQVKNIEDHQSIIKALDNFLQSDVVKGEAKFIPHGSTWFNNRWRDYLDIRVATGKSQAMIDMERMIEDDRKRGVSGIPRDGA
jgi:hypothetical protein